MMLYLAAALIIAGVALFVAAPLGVGIVARKSSAARAELDRLEHERSLAIQGLRELEFDHEMGKLADPDFETLRASLETRALAAMSALDNLRAAHGFDPNRGSSAAPPARPKLVQKSSATPVVYPRFCPECGARIVPGNFCCQCGTPLDIAVHAAAQADR